MTTKRGRGGVGRLDDSFEQGSFGTAGFEQIGVEGFEASNEESGGCFGELGLAELHHFATGEEASGGGALGPENEVRRGRHRTDEVHHLMEFAENGTFAFGVELGGLGDVLLE